MKERNIFENNERQEINNKLIIHEVLTKKTKQLQKDKYYTIIIYLNLIVIYFILYKLYISNKNNLNYIKWIYHNSTNFSKICYSREQYFNSIINKYKRTSIVWPLSEEIKFKPLMSEKEIKAFLYFMKPGNIYFEFGSGGSTNLASYYKIKTYSVESDVKWHEYLKKNGINANYITIDLKVTKAGYPGNETNINDWKKYVQAYKSEYNADIILIDGRFRVACALDIFEKIRNDTIILIHDYEPRKQYHILENFYIKIKSWDTLSLFIKNPNIDFIPKNIYNFYLKEKLI